MARIIRSSCLAAVCVAAATAQDVVLPPSAASSAPTSVNTNTPFVFYSDTLPPRASHCQLIYPTRDVGHATAVWRSLAVRRPADLAWMNHAGFAQATVVISVSPLAYDAMTATFAANHGPQPVTVLSGPVSLPARARPSAWPAPWDTVIPFTTPLAFNHTSGQSLVIDILQSGSTAPAAWLCEATSPDPGDRTDNPRWQSTCRFSNGEFNDRIGYQPPTLGALWYVWYQTLPPGLAGVGVLGTRGVGGSWSNLQLPIDLAPIGAPGCTWNVSMDVMVPLTSTTNTYQWPVLRIPSAPELAGASFYDHAFFLDPPANPAGIVTTWSSRWKVGTHPGVAAALLYTFATVTGSPTGTLRGRTGVSIKLQS